MSSTKGMAIIDFSDTVNWRIVPVAGTTDIFNIYNNHASLNGAGLSWDTMSSTKGMVTVDVYDPIEWRIVPVAGSCDGLSHPLCPTSTPTRAPSEAPTF
jgi:hypothetical protein